MKRRDLRFLWSSNSVWSNSGYGVFSRDLLFRLAKDGWPVGHIGWWGLEGHSIYVHGEDIIDDRFKNTKIKVYPKMADMWGSDAIISHSVDYKANALFTMQDIHLLNPQHLQQMKVFIPYVPIDKDPAPPEVLQRLQYAYKIITFSEFGRKVLEKAGFTSTLILEGTDTEVFKPMDKEESRKMIGLPNDVFMFGMISANKENPPRKGFQEVIEAFKMFYDRHPEAALFFHVQQPNAGGFPILQYARYLGVDKRIFVMNDYTAIFNSNSTRIAREINCFDIYLQPSQTEGFGLTSIEAQACGKPVIVNNCTAMPETVIKGVTGEICDTNYKRWTNDLSFVYTSDPKSLYDKMEAVYKMIKDDPKKVAESCRKHIVEKYDIDTIVEKQWIPLFEELQNELVPVQVDKKEEKK